MPYGVTSPFSTSKGVGVEPVPNTGAVVAVGSLVPVPNKPPIVGVVVASVPPIAPTVPVPPGSPP